MGRILGIVATVLFAVALILALVGGQRDLVTYFTLGGLTAFAAAHVT